MAKANKRTALEALTKKRLAKLVSDFGLEVSTSKPKDTLVDALARAKHPSLAEVLEQLNRDELKDICQAHGLNDSGKGKKAAIIARLMGEAPGGQPTQTELRLDKGATAASVEPKRRKKRAGKGESTVGATLGFEQTLWQAADKLRNNMDAAEYKHVVLGLIFLKYISDAFFEKHEELLNQVQDGADPEDPDEYRGDNIFWVPPEARWQHLQDNAKQPTIGKLVDDAMRAIERENPTLKNVLPKDYARPALDKQRLGELIDLIGTIGLGSKENQAQDVLGRVYEYFLAQFALAEGRNAGQFFTPQSVVRLLVAMLAPYKGRVLDPCCGSGGMFVQSEDFIEAHGGRVGDISVYGQESNATTWRLAKMNLAIRRIDANLGETWADSFRKDQHRDLKADYVLANPPFNDSDWGGQALREDVRWKFGAPPVGNANFAWVQHFIHHLSPTGMAGFVLANGSMWSQQSGEGEIRKAIIEGDLVDCIVALPGQLFYSTPTSVCLWFLARDRANGRGARGRRLRSREHQTLFIDARKLGRMADRSHRELAESDVARIVSVYHRWRGDADGEYEDVAGFCKSATTEEIAAHGYVLSPSSYVGTEPIQEESRSFDTWFGPLVEVLEKKFSERAMIEARIRSSLHHLARKGVAASTVSGWREVPLRDCGRWLSGGTPSTSVPEYWGGDIPWITASSLHNFRISDSERKLTELGLANGSRLVPAGTVIFVVRGMSLKQTFRVGIAIRPVAFGQDCKAICPHPDVDPLFLAYSLRAKAAEILGLVDEAGHGTGRLATGVLGRLTLQVPTIEEQRAISSVLGALEEHLEVNRQMSDMADCMAQALFKSWTSGELPIPEAED